MIEVKNLTKIYGDNRAVDNLNFTVQDGQIYGFLGPNGAGKTTTMNIMVGCLAATEGQVIIEGHDIFEEPREAKRSLGYLPEQPPLYLDMTPSEYLGFVGEVKGLSKTELRAHMQYAMEQTQILDVQNRLIKNLSKGYRQRVGVAQALLGDPKIIILDEPTVGLDPKQIIEIRDLIRNLGRNHTVILSSHILSEVSAICDHVLIISHGKMVASDTPENLSRKLLNAGVLSLIVRGAEADVRDALGRVSRITSLAFTAGQEAGTLRVNVEVEKEADVREDVFFALAEARFPLLQMTTSSATLEEVFLELTSDSYNEAGTTGVHDILSDDFTGFETVEEEEEGGIGHDSDL